MPEVTLDHMTIYYESHGQGSPLVMIRGVGSNADHWYSQVPELAARYRTIVFDNRGIARSSDTGGKLSISMMAEDTLGLMDGLGIDRAHVMGLSMGGMIAQQLAVKYPERVAGLILACTHPGGRHQVSPGEDVMALFTKMVHENTLEARLNAAPCMFDPETLKDRPEVAAGYAEISLKHPAGTGILIRQWEAVQGHDTYDQLNNIQSPTLVLTGDGDVLIPPENSEILARHIPDSRLKIIPGGGHQILVEQAQLCNQAICEFLESLS